MPYELIPFPLSLIFVLIFGFVVEVVLWKLRKNGGVYRLLSNLAVAVGAIVFVLVLAVIVQNLL